MKVRQVSHAIGAEITEIDLSHPLSDEQWKDIYAAWLKYIVLIFPGQKLTPEQLIAFAGRFGPLDDHREDPASRLDGYPEIFLIGNHMVDGKLSRTRDTGRMWHSDHSYTTRPTLISMLYCRNLPPTGGTTAFSNMYMAYDMLSGAMKDLLDQLEGVHDLLHLGSRSTLYRKRGFKNSASIAERYPPVAHPLVLVHPETGRKALYVSEGPVNRVAGMTDDESWGLLQFLFKHTATLEFTYRHTYSVDDLVFWDNRACQHIALADFVQDPNTPRLMQRLTVLGKESGRVYDENATSTNCDMSALERGCCQISKL
jgi:taurine dioxygenase